MEPSIAETDNAEKAHTHTHTPPHIQTQPSSSTRRSSDINKRPSTDFICPIPMPDIEAVQSHRPTHSSPHPTSTYTSSTQQHQQQTDTTNMSKSAEDPSCMTSITTTDSRQDAYLQPGASPSSSLSSRVKLVRDAHGRFDLPPSSRLINDVPWIIGFMELANAGDFAANVWNTVPVPVYALVFMAIGATAAGVISLFAFRDTKLARRNVNFLRRQYREQKDERDRRQRLGMPTRDMDVLVDITFRELGTEAITRWIMDWLMGCGGMLICVGTYMAMGGENRRVWIASNLLSGYIGNVPIALYGLVNSSWALYLYLKARRHINVTRDPLKDREAGLVVRRRCRNVQILSMLTGPATLMGGVGSMLTATRWWGYAILLPVILSSIFCNVWWRRRVGYTRSPSIGNIFPSLSAQDLANQCEFFSRAQKTIKYQKECALGQFVTDETSLFQVASFMEEQGLLDLFLVKLMANTEIFQALGGDREQMEMEVGVEDIAALEEGLHPVVIDIANRIVTNFGIEHFQYKERYAAELLGTYYAIAWHESHDAHREK